MEDCIFCRIVKKSNKAEIIYEDEYNVAFLDIMPRAPGHTIVIPKEHQPDLLNLSRESLEHIGPGVAAVAQKLLNALNPDGLTYGINQGKVSGQEVAHVHVHIMPRWYDDKGHTVQSVVNNKPEESLGKIAEKIRQAK